MSDLKVVIIDGMEWEVLKDCGDFLVIHRNDTVINIQKKDLETFGQTNKGDGEEGADATGEGFSSFGPSF